MVIVCLEGGRGSPWQAAAFGRWSRGLFPTRPRSPVAVGHFDGSRLQRRAGQSAAPTPSREAAAWDSQGSIQHRAVFRPRVRLPRSAFPRCGSRPTAGSVFPIPASSSFKCQHLAAQTTVCKPGGRQAPGTRGGEGRSCRTPPPNPCPSPLAPSSAEPAAPSELAAETCPVPSSAATRFRGLLQ